MIVIMAFGFASLVGSFTDLPDWKVFWDASMMLDNPYDRFGFLNPYWTAWLLAPLHSFTKDYLIGYGLWTVVTLSVAAFVLRDSKFYLIMNIASPHFMHQIVNGQIDAFVVIGYYLMTQTNYQRFAPMLMLIKPQAMAGALVVWGTKNIIRKRLYWGLAIIGILSVIGFVLYGNWIKLAIDNIHNGLYQPVNASWVFNYPIVGICIMIVGIWRKNVFLGGLATLFLTPYVAMHSLWVYWTAWLMGKPNKILVILLAILNWYIALRFTI